MNKFNKRNIWEPNRVKNNYKTTRALKEWCFAIETLLVEVAWTSTTLRNQVHKPGISLLWIRMGSWRSRCEKKCNRWSKTKRTSSGKTTIKRMEPLTVKTNTDRATEVLTTLHLSQIQIRTRMLLCLSRLVCRRHLSKTKRARISSISLMWRRSKTASTKMGTRLKRWCFRNSSQRHLYRRSILRS